jgi:hypothetical protein
MGRCPLQVSPKVQLAGRSLLCYPLITLSLENGSDHDTHTHTRLTQPVQFDSVYALCPLAGERVFDAFARGGNVTLYFETIVFQKIVTTEICDRHQAGDLHDPPLLPGTQGERLGLRPLTQAHLQASGSIPE